MEAGSKGEERGSLSALQPFYSVPDSEKKTDWVEVSVVRFLIVNFQLA